MIIKKAKLFGSPYIGIFCLVNDNYAFVPRMADEKFLEILKELDVDIVEASIAGTNLLGIFAAISNKKAFLPNIVEKEERKLFEERLDVILVEEKYTALGNLIAMNDHNVLASPLLADAIGAVEGKVGESDLVGSLVYVNNRGFLVSPDGEHDIPFLKKVFKVDGDIGTVNFGDKFVASGVVGNSRGIIVGENTSGPELERIEDIFLG